MPKGFIEIKDDKLILKLGKLTPEIKDTLLDETQEQSRKLTNWIIKNHLSGGTTDSRLKVRSGMFRRMTLPIIPKQLLYLPIPLFILAKINVVQCVYFL